MAGIPNGLNFPWFCWYSKLWSIVTNASNSRSAARNNSPFAFPCYPQPLTVIISNSSANSPFRKQLMFSSSSTRTTCLSFDGMQSYLQECLGLLAADCGKAIEKSVKRFTRFNDERAAFITLADDLEERIRTVFIDG
jgi:hypothetical protein